MRIRITSKASLPYEVAGGAVIMVAFSAALFLPERARLLCFVGTVAFLILTRLAITRQKWGRADFGLVSISERRAFLVSDTALTVVVLTSLGLVLLVAIAVRDNIIRVSVGHLALVSGALANAYRVRGAMEHAARVSPQPDFD